MEIDLNLPVKLVDPQEGEEEMVFLIINHNEVTQRVMIREMYFKTPLPSIELVSINHVKNI